MENKYYIPEIEELHIGFEYEFKHNSGEWKTMLIDNLTALLDTIDWDLPEEKVRVKYLDKEDIENLGLKYNELTKDFETTIQGRTDTSIFEYWLTLIEFKKNVGWKLTINGEDNENSFNGIIKNKSELIKLLKQLGITNE